MQRLCNDLYSEEDIPTNSRDILTKFIRQGRVAVVYRLDTSP